MFGLPSAVKIFLFTEPVDMRKGFDGLSAVAQKKHLDPTNGHLYIFVSKRRNRIKILFWHRGGYVIWYKRLEQGRLVLPAVLDDSGIAKMDPGQLSMLLDGVDLSKVRRVRAWEPKTKSAYGIDLKKLL